jgi:hypothetical protein
MDLVLTRVYVGPEGAFGTIAPVDKPPFLVSVEHTYEDNAVKVPIGTYTCQRTLFNRGGYDTFEITGVQGHDRLLFHRGNTEDDSDGCVLVGLQYGLVNGESAVLSSISAMTLFMMRQSNVDTFQLEVI